MKITTLDGVVRPGEVLMSLLPDQDNLVVEARLPPTDIDQVYVGQIATLMFTSFNMRTTPQLNGTVSRVSPDISVDEATGEAYYLTRLSIPLKEQARLSDQQIVPGMPVDAFILTGERTLINYILQPIMDHLQRALREE
jgi:HlyD family secretion protein